MDSLEWKAHKKHFFILSNAGKPIYSRYGTESKLSSLMGMLQVLVSCVQEQQDTIKTVSVICKITEMGNHDFVFLEMGPLYLVCVANTNEQHQVISQELEMMHRQIVFTLTQAQITKIFSKHTNFDLRNLLGGMVKSYLGTDVLLDCLAQSFHSPSVSLDAYPVFKIKAKTCKMVTKAWQSAQPPKSLFFGMLIAHKKVVGLFQPPKYKLVPKGYLLLMQISFLLLT